ncbi:MAG: hypothetical protein IKW14_03755 [Phascolarctobacterium sp.]|nr:hypothetical protein [Phascolarctobacterium sp.]
MKKLFFVKALTYDNFDPSFLYIAETEQEAGNRAYERLEGQVYSIYPNEITEVDGYEVKLVKKEGND